MKVLNQTARLLCTAMAVALATGCHKNSQAYLEQQGKEAGRSGSEGDATVVQAGAPRQLATPVDPSSEPAPEAKPEDTKGKRAPRRRTYDAEPRGESEAMDVWKMDQKQIDHLLSDGSSDNHMLGMYLMANDVDLSYAKLALAVTESADVRAFAKRMLTDHTQMSASLNALVTGRDFVPADNRLSRDLRDRATIHRDSLRTLSGQDFDSAYVATELDSHKQLLSLIDDVLLPRAHDGELRELLANMRPVISAHLAHADQLQAAMAKR